MPEKITQFYNTPPLSNSQVLDRINSRKPPRGYKFTWEEGKPLSFRGKDKWFLERGRRYLVGGTRVEYYWSPEIPPIVIISTSPEKISRTKDRLERMLQLILEETNFPQP